VGTSDRAARLREMADALDTQDELEAVAREAKVAYAADPNEETKAAHAAAAAALHEARSDARSSGLMVASSSPGSVTVSPSPVAGKAG